MVGNPPKMISSSKISVLLLSSENGSELKSLIQEDIKEYRAGRKTKGTSLPIKIEITGKTFSISKEAVENLIDFYLNEEINEVELEYLANILELCDDFEYDELVSETIFLLSTPEINGELTKESVLSIKQELNGFA